MNSSSKKYLAFTSLVFAVPSLYGACNARDIGGAPDTLPDVRALPNNTPPDFPAPHFGETSTQENPPPPISGATMTLAEDGHTVVVSDPDRDRAYVVDVPSRVVTTVLMKAGDEPGRGSAGPKLAYIALRGSGELATIRLRDGAIQERRYVCRAPRGVAYDRANKFVHVACADGDLVTFPAEGGPETRRVAVARDLRDIVIGRGGMYVSRFRGAPLFVDDRGNFDARSSSFELPVTWRMTTASVRFSDPDGGAGTTGGGESEPEVGPIEVGQLPSTETVSTAPGGYGGSGGSGSGPSCKGSGIIVKSVVRFPNGRTAFLPAAVLPVDIATNGHEVAVVAAGNGHTKEMGQLFLMESSAGTEVGPPSTCADALAVPLPGQAVAALFDSDDNLIVQSRQPAELYIMAPDRARVWKTIPLDSTNREDTGHAIFHANAGGGLACASCHLEGGDDGHVWSFDNEGQRRTPSLLGTVANTEPFHWSGDMKDMSTLMDRVFVERMSGPKIDAPQLSVLTRWVNKLPAPKPMPHTAASERGAENFKVRGCGNCHSGTMLTNNLTVDVGTEGKFQVPSLVGVGWRSSLMHNGCAPSLADRFDPSCGGDKHGAIMGLGRDELQDLLAYLRTL